MDEDRLMRIWILPLLVLATGCAGGDKAGGSAAPVTLRIGTDDGPGSPSATAIAELGRQARAVSGGRIRIVAAWKAAGPTLRDWDQRVARLVRSGDVELGLIPTRAWDTEGVTSLRALNAPFLVTSEPLVKRLVTSDLVGPMLAGLDRAGVVGVALVPESLRHPFGFDRALTSVADFSGTTIRTPRSDVSYALYRRLGATPEDLVDAEFARGVADGSVEGADSSYALAAASLPRPAVATGNVTPYAKLDSLVVNPGIWARLGDRGRDQLREAARRTVARLLDTIVPDAAAARSYCDHGGSVVLAAPQDVAALEAATRPVYAELERDAPTKALIARIRALARGVRTPVAPPPCGSREPLPAPVAGAIGAPGTFPQGVYRADLPEPFLVAHGMDAGAAHDSGGLQTVTIAHGRWRIHTEHNTVGGPDCTGRYAAADGRVKVIGDPGPGCGSSAGIVLLDAAWTLRERELRFADISSDDADDTFVRVFWGSRPWLRIS